MARLEGKVAIVTGAGAGIGQAVAERFAAEGANVVCVDRDAGAAEAVAAAVGGTAVVADVSSEADCEAMATAATEAHGGIDLLVANAGIGGPGRAGDVDRATWDRVLAVNLTGIWQSSRAAIPSMSERGGGSIVFVASIAALVGVPEVAAYAAAKGGVVALGRQMAVDYAAAGIRVNVICPGAVWTPLTAATYEHRGEGAGEDARAAAAARYPLKRLGRTEDIAGGALYLCSAEAGWVTGSVIPLDGGFTAQ